MYENITYCSAGKFVSQGEWIHPDRVINSYELIFVLSGTVYINEDNVDYQLKKNEILLLSPTAHHFGYKKSSDTSFFWIHFTGDAPINVNMKYQMLSDTYNLSLLFKQLLHYQSDNQTAECLNYITRLILIEVFSLRSNNNSNKIVAEVAAWVSSNKDSLITVEQVSEHFGYNTDYISRLFKMHYGKKLKEYINDVKASYIKQLLLTSNLSLTDVAYSTGFEDYKYFLKFFKYHEGVTPSQFLKSYPKTHINSK